MKSGTTGKIKTLILNEQKNKLNKKINENINRNINESLRKNRYELKKIICDALGFEKLDAFVEKALERSFNDKKVDLKQFKIDMDTWKKSKPME
jgi:sulfite reductase beta subunit-like hemoprotein